MLNDSILFPFELLLIAQGNDEAFKLNETDVPAGSSKI